MMVAMPLRSLRSDVPRPQAAFEYSGLENVTIFEAGP
jgi:hypothetical protein